MVKNSLSKNKINWTEELGLDWSTALSDILSSDYFEHLNNFIEQIYLSDKEIYPVRHRLFKSFEKCSLKDVKIIIIDNRPAKDKRSSGVGRGIIESSSLIKDIPTELREFRDCIFESIYGNQFSITNFDNSLYDYCDNDMLFLNCSMCVEKDKEYTIIWKHFIRNIIQEINKRKEKIVYVFLTGDNLDLRDYIDETKNKVIVNPFSIVFSYSEIFIELDKYIEDNYPPFNRILW